MIAAEDQLDELSKENAALRASLSKTERFISEALSTIRMLKADNKRLGREVHKLGERICKLREQQSATRP